jgi:hypothetical protein
MSAFSREQIEVLQAEFEHVWGQMSRLREDLNEDSTRLVTLLQMLVEHGVLSAEQFEAAVDELRATAGIESGLASLARPRVTEESITAQILNGDTEAFKRRRAAEEEQFRIDSVRQRDVGCAGKPYDRNAEVICETSLPVLSSGPDAGTSRIVPKSPAPTAKDGRRQRP